MKKSKEIINTVNELFDYWFPLIAFVVIMAIGIWVVADFSGEVKLLGLEDNATITSPVVLLGFVGISYILGLWSQHNQNKLDQDDDNDDE